MRSNSQCAALVYICSLERLSLDKWNETVDAVDVATVKKVDSSINNTKLYLDPVM